jgi:hypothetical protein
MALPILVDGAALDPTSFGELDDDGYWNPIEFTGRLHVHASITVSVSSGSRISGTDNTATWLLTAVLLLRRGSVLIMDYVYPRHLC